MAEYFIRATAWRLFWSIKEPSLCCFFYHKRKECTCRVKLCGSCKKQAGSSADLHELHGIKRKAVKDQGGDLSKADGFGQKSLEPEQKIPPDNGFHVVLIDRRVIFANGIAVRAVFIGADDPVLVRKRDPVVGNNGRRKNGVRPAAFRAPDTADPQRDVPIRLENASFIVRMNRKTGRVPAGTGKPVELELIKDGIVRSLRKLIVITDRYEYHGLVQHSPLRVVTGVGTADGLSQGESAVLFNSNGTDDTTKGTA